MEGTGTEETVVEGPLVESSANKKWVGEGAVNKNRELINLQLIDRELRTCKFHFQMDCFFPSPYFSHFQNLRVLLSMH